MNNSEARLFSSRFPEKAEKLERKINFDQAVRQDQEMRTKNRELKKDPTEIARAWFKIFFEKVAMQENSREWRRIIDELAKTLPTTAEEKKLRVVERLRSPRNLPDYALIRHEQARHALAKTAGMAYSPFNNFPPRGYDDFYQDPQNKQKIKSLSARQLLERASFVLSYIPQAAYLQYSAEIVQSLINQARQSGQWRHAEKLEQKRDSIITDLAFWNNETASLFADYADDEIFHDRAGSLWQEFGEEVVFIDSQLNIHQDEEYFFSQLIKKPIPEYFLPPILDNLTKFTKAGITAEATIFHLMRELGLVHCAATPDWDKQMKVDGIAQQKNHDQELIFCQIKSDAGRLGIQTTSLNETNTQNVADNPKKISDADKLVKVARIYSQEKGVSVVPAWIVVGRGIPVDKNTGVMLGSFMTNPRVKTAGKEIFDLFHRGGKVNVEKER